MQKNNMRIVDFTIQIYTIIGQHSAMKKLQTSTHSLFLIPHSFFHIPTKKRPSQKREGPYNSIKKTTSLLQTPHHLFYLHFRQWRQHRVQDLRLHFAVRHKFPDWRYSRHYLIRL